MSHKAKPSSKTEAFTGQRPGERVELVFHQHPLVMRKPLIGGLLLILLVVSPLAFYEVWTIEWLAAILLKAAIIVPLLVAVIWFWSWVGWYYTVYIVTDQRILEIRQKGLFRRRVSEWQLDRILNINYEISGLQAVLFSFGDITVQTVIGDLRIPTVHKPVYIHDQLQDIVRRDLPAGSPAATMPWSPR